MSKLARAKEASTAKAQDRPAVPSVPYGLQAAPKAEVLRPPDTRPPLTQLTTFSFARLPVVPSEPPPELPPLLLADDNLHLPPTPQTLGAPIPKAPPEVELFPREAPLAPLAREPVVGVVSAPAPTLPAPTPANEFPGAVQPAGPTDSEKGSTVPSFPTAGKVWLDPRDSFSLVAQWEVDDAANDAFAERSGGGSWRVRVFANDLGGLLMAEQDLRSTHHRLIPVLYAGVPYVAELGFLSATGEWRGLAVSMPVKTPPDSPSEIWAERTAVFDTPVVADVVEDVPTSPMEESLQILETDSPGPVDALILPDVTQAAALVSLVWEPAPVIVTSDSASISQLVGRVISVAGPPPLPASAEVVGPGLPAPRPSPAPNPASGESGPTIPPARPGFWFEVNAELIVYGRTECDAKVSVAGRSVVLRDDGSFSFRFSLPDGEYALPAVAINAAGNDGRSAQLTFSRNTVYQGVVGQHPQDPALSSPVAEAIR